MKDVNKALRKKYYELLNGSLNIENDPVPVYYKYLPNNIDKPYYVIIRTVSNTEISTKQLSNTDTSIQLGIYTKDTVANPGSYADDIAGQIYTIIYPTPQSTIDLEPDFQVAVTKLDNDISPDAIQSNNAVFVNRFITFAHKILHR